MGEGKQCLVFCCFIVIIALVIGAIVGFDKIIYGIFAIFSGLGGG